MSFLSHREAIKLVQDAAWKVSRKLARKDRQFAYILLVSDMGSQCFHSVSAGLSDVQALDALRQQLKFFDENRDALAALVRQTMAGEQ